MVDGFRRITPTILAFPFLVTGFGWVLRRVSGFEHAADRRADGNPVTAARPVVFLLAAEDSNEHALAGGQVGSFRDGHVLGTGAITEVAQNAGAGLHLVQGVAAHGHADSPLVGAAGAMALGLAVEGAREDGLTDAEERNLANGHELFIATAVGAEVTKDAMHH